MSCSPLLQRGGELNTEQYNKIAGGFETFPPPNIQGLSDQQQQPQGMPSMGGAGGDMFSSMSGANTSAATGGFATDYSFNGGPSSYATGQPQHQQQQQYGMPQQQQTTGFGGDVTGNFGSLGGMGSTAPTDVGGAAGGSGGTAWPPVSPTDLAAYQRRFQAADNDGDGKLAGGEVVPVLMSLDAPKARPYSCSLCTLPHHPVSV